MLKLTVGRVEKCSPDKKITKQIIHFDCAVHYIIDGEGYFNGRKLTKGMGFTTCKNEYVEYHPDKNNPWTYVWFRVEGNDSEEIFYKSGIPTSSAVFDVHNLDRIKTVAFAVLGENSYEPSSETEREALAKLMLSLNAKEERIAKNDYAGKAKEFIDKNFHKVTVESVASFVGVDRKYLRLLFVKRYGIPTMDYVMKKRMERAKELLSQTTQGIGVVAMSVGYDDALGFSRIFKKYVGVSPKEYREQNSAQK